MVNCVEHSESSVYLNNLNSAILAGKNIKESDDIKSFFGVLKPKENLDEFIDRDKEFLSTCTDGEDDGKIGFKEGAKAFLGGVANHYLNSVEEIKDFVKKNPQKSSLLATGALVLGGLAIATFGAPLVLGAISVAGIAFGVKSVVNGVKGAVGNIKDAKNATTDAEKKEALYGLGGNSAEVVDGAVAIYGGAKGLQTATKAISQVDDYARCIGDTTEEIQENLDDLLKKVEDDSLSQEEMEVLKEFLDKKEEFIKKEKLSSVLFGVLGSKFSFPQST